jgi:hypothetical protein
VNVLVPVTKPEIITNNKQKKKKLMLEAKILIFLEEGLAALK